MSSAVKSLIGEWGRFFAVNVAGLVVDLGTAIILRSFGVNIFIAASISFTIAAFVNFHLHNRWTFQGRMNGPDGRLAAYYMSALVTIGARLVFLKALKLLDLPAFIHHDIALLFLATGGSLVVNYLLCKYLIFRR